MIGETVGSYKVLEKLGEGGMGEVYLAEHKYIARRAAIKFLLPELTASSDVVTRFFSEARAASLIRHPGIVEVLDCEIHRDGRAYIVMELLSGENVRAYLGRTGKMDGDPAGALAICWQIAVALSAAHAEGIVHRDLKPDNVFLHLPNRSDAHKPIVKVVDFGIAKLMGGGEAGSKTRTGQLLGTPLYMSPEQCRGARQVDGQSDVYSIGCIMFEIFCGRPPFVEEGFGDLIIAHVSQPPPDPLEFAPSMSPALRDVLLHCLEKQPANRPASMEEVSRRLAAVGAPQVVYLASPVVPGAAAAESIASGRARSPGGWAATPARVATTPFPISSATPKPSGAAPLSTPITPHAGGTRVLPTPKPSTLSEATAEMFAREPRRAGRAKIIVPVIALAAGAVAVVIALRIPGGKPSASATETPYAASAGPAEERKYDRRVVAPPGPAAESPSSTSIRLTGLPGGATVRLDGQPATPPLSVPHGTRHRLSIEAKGYETWERAIDGIADQTIAVELKEKAPAPGSPSNQKQRSKHRHGSPAFGGFSDL